jgi:hypothetical protein
MRHSSCVAANPGCVPAFQQVPPAESRPSAVSWGRLQSAEGFSPTLQTPEEFAAHRKRRSERPPAGKIACHTKCRLAVSLIGALRRSSKSENSAASSHLKSPRQAPPCSPPPPCSRILTLRSSVPLCLLRNKIYGCWKQRTWPTPTPKQKIARRSRVSSLTRLGAPSQLLCGDLAVSVNNHAS